MPRTARIAPGGIVYHVLNRSVGGTHLFRSDSDFAAFLRTLIDTLTAMPSVRLLAFCIMGNHWHLVLWPARDGDLARFMLRLTTTHVRRWIEYHRRHRDGLRITEGHVYQGRYRSFACASDEHFLALVRYVERNPLRARIVRRAERWRYSSLGQRDLPAALRVPLSDWPVDRPRNWVNAVNRAQTPAEEEALRRCVREGRPYGSDESIARTIGKLGWREPRGPGRPRKYRASNE